MTDQVHQVQKVQRTRSGPPQESAKWLDPIVLIAVLVGTTAAVIAAVQNGAFQGGLLSDEKLSWHLVRAGGLTAYSLLGASTLWGLILSSRIIKDWSPGPMAMLLHTTVSWLAVGLSVAHAGMLMFDTYFKYTLRDLIVPFVGPYRPVEVGLGVLGLWLAFTIAISFGQRKRIGQKAWRWLHYTSYVAFLLVTAHSLTAGTDSGGPGLKLLTGFFTFSTFGLLGLRILRQRTAKQAH